MSGRGRNGGGRSNYHGGHGRSGQQGRGRGGHGNRNNQYNHSRENGASEKAQKPERFMLDSKASTAKVNKWFREQETYAGENYHRSGIQWVVNITNPGDLPFVERPEEPEEQFYQKVVVPADEANGIAEVTELDERRFSRAEWQYREDVKEYNRKSEIIETETRAMFYSMKGYTTEDAQREIESRTGKDIWMNEDPKELAEAVKEVFLANNEGFEGNELDADHHDTRFRNISQRHGQSVSQFYNYFLQQFQALRVTELSTGKTEDEFDAYWTEKRKSVLFINRLDETRGGEWLRGFKFRGKKLPETLDEAYKEACNAEKEYQSVHRQQHQYERINTFHGAQRNDGHGNGVRNYSRAVSTGSGKLEVWEDAEGNPTCHDYRRNPEDCTYGDLCKFSHKPAVRLRTYGVTNGGNNSNRQAKDTQETDRNIDRAVVAAKKKLGVGFQNPPTVAEAKAGSKPTGSS